MPLVQVQGDLDPKVSPHYLTTMKKAYLKLRYLVDSGCIFVGHDLRHDFKSINIIVPPHQVRTALPLFFCCFALVAICFFFSHSSRCRWGLHVVDW